MCPDDTASDAAELLTRAEVLSAEFSWADAATLFRIAAREYHTADDHLAEAHALRRAAQNYEALQPWRNAGMAWLDAAEAYSGHPHRADELARESEAGEAYLWAGYTFWWAEQRADSFRAHFIAGDEFKQSGDLRRAERAYKFAAISKAKEFATTTQVGRDVHPFFDAFAARDPLVDLADVAALRQQVNDEATRRFSARTHIDTLFAIRRALEEVGNQTEASRVYQLEMTARRQYAHAYEGALRWLWFCGFGEVIGYGESYSRFAAWSIFVFVLLFPAIYAAPVFQLNGAHDFRDDIYFSIVTATTVGYGDMQPQGWLKAVANVESLVGLVAFGMLVALLVRRVIRSN